MNHAQLRLAFNKDARVKLVGSDYTFEGYVVTIFPKKRTGKLRCVVQNDDDCLHIFSPGNLDFA